MTQRNRTRAGFSLVELLVVISILALLAALVMAGVTAVKNRQMARAAEDIVSKLQVGIDNQVKALVDQALKDRKDRTRDFQSLVAYCDGDEDRAQALLVYLKLRHAFPQSYAEAVAPVTLAGTTINWPPHKAYANLPNLTSWTGSPPGSPPAERAMREPMEQSAAILHAGLTNMAAGGNAFSADEATASAQIDYAPEGGAIPARLFKDAWGRPVGFVRFGTNAELQAAPYVNENDLRATPRRSVDPFDPQGKLWHWNPTPPAKRTNARDAVFLRNGDAANAVDFDGTNRLPVAYSLGGNKWYESLNNTPPPPPYDATVSPKLDDVIGYRLKKLGGRGTKGVP